MRRLRIFFPFIAAFFVLAGCSEIMPVIPEPTPPDEIKRKVMIEEFTGVTCVNCPQGAAEIENLLSIYGDNLIAVAVHAGFFAQPDPSRNSQDFRTAEGDFLIGFLGEPQGYPSAVIDRKLLNGSTELQQSQGAWAGLIDQELQQEAAASLIIEHNYDPESRFLEMNLSSIFAQSLNESVNISVLVTENDIVEPQLTPDGWDMEYKHKHMMREYLTNVSGEEFAVNPSSGASFSKTIRYTIPEDYVVNNLEIVAFIHLAGNVKDVLQIESIKLND